MSEKNDSLEQIELEFPALNHAHFLPRAVNPFTLRCSTEI